MTDEARPSDDEVTIEALDAGGAAAHLPELAALLQDAVDGGASVGFLPPLTPDQAAAYWRGVVDDLAAGSRLLLVARRRDLPIAGSVQLELVGRANGRHRAEVAKLMVHRAARRRGLGRALMLAIEAAARRHGRSTLVLDTRQGDPSEALYRSLGYTLAGAIPRYARSADGTLDATALYYKLL